MRIGRRGARRRRPGVERERPDRRGVGQTLARAAGVGALIVGVVFVAFVLLGGDSGHQYKLLFQTGGQLVPGNQVLVGGQPIGTVDSLKLTDDAQAEVAITVDDPLHQGTTATIRATSLSGVANRYVSIAPGANSEPDLADGAVIPADKTTSPVDLDQLFNTLDKPTRTSLQKVIQGQATLYTGNNPEARSTYKYFAPGLQSTTKLLAELTRDQQSLSEFLVKGSTALGAIAERRDDLAALTSNANQALGAIADRNEDFDRLLVALPPTMRQANTTFVNLRAALDDLDPTLAALGDVAPDLPPFLRRLTSVSDASVSVFKNLTASISLPGPANDLNDSLRDLPGGENAASESVAPTLAALDDSTDLIDFAVPYTPDLMGFISKFGQVTAYYDGEGHYARVLPASQNLFSWDQNTQQLTAIPPSQQQDVFPSLGLGPFTRCPGGATQPNLSWPSPTDHPFLGGGDSLRGACDPDDVPPGP
jgi:phospholipid/cholesterol/gamma-HCH transport system substrate-binding protein